ncbi:MAG: right-handed parallel beta-helix repeat-containing protein [Geminicoccaceae bacterium]
MARFRKLTRATLLALLGTGWAQAAAAGPCSPEAPATGSLFVAPSGRDDATGSFLAPFATLARAQRVMAASGIRSTYVRAGRYALAAPLTLTAADTGSGFLACPGETVVLDGAGRLATLVALDQASQVTLSGLTLRRSLGPALTLTRASGNLIQDNRLNDNAAGILLTGAGNNTISGNRIVTTATSAIEAKDGSDGNLLERNWISGTGAIGTSGGGFFLHGASNNRIAGNTVENTAGMGIGIENWDDYTINIGNQILGNVVRNANTDARSNDSGAIYMLGRSQRDTQAVIAGNVVNGTGRGPDEGAHTIGIYLDDLTSGVLVQNNIVRRIGTHGAQLHGGRQITVRNNIFHLGPGRASAILFQAAPPDTHPSIAMTDNLVTRNIVYSESSSPVSYDWIAGGDPVIIGNLYHNVTGAAMTTQPPAFDRGPMFGDPRFADPAHGNYRLLPGSAAALIGFEPITRPTP